MKKIAFIKFGGLATGGTEKWLQTIAANLPKDKYEVTFFYCDTAPYLGSDFKHPDTDPNRLEYMQKSGVKLQKFHVGQKNVTVSTHDWIGTNFWDVFKEENYDLVCTGRAGHSEYPFHLIRKVPIVEFVTLAGMADNQSNIVKSVHISKFQADSWVRAGGNPSRIEIVPLFAELPLFTKLGSLRSKLGLRLTDFVFGFHQRDDRGIVSTIPLQAYKTIENPNTVFLMLGGDTLYSNAAAQLGIKRFHQLPHTGNPDEIHEFLNTLDVYSHGRADGETFGHVLAEALSHGLPCVSHVAPNMGHVETIGPAGVVVNDMDSYVSFLKQMMQDRAFYQKLSKAAKEHFHKELSLETGMKKISKMFDEVFETENLKNKDAEAFWNEMY